MSVQLIFDFLAQLKNNNEKDWMHANKPLYQEAKNSFIEMVGQSIQHISMFDEHIAGLDAKKCIFRVNRDIRFSKDKRPYKENFGAAIARGGRKSKFGGYYLHLQPGNSFLAGGCYMPQSAELAAIRQEIDYNAQDLRTILAQSDFKKYFGQIEGAELKTAPKGYPKDHEDIDLLKKKSFTVWHRMKDEQVLKKDFLEHAAKVFHAMHPFNEFLNTAVAETENS